MPREGLPGRRTRAGFGYGGKLDIRPPFQREFIYKPKERNAVVRGDKTTGSADKRLNVIDTGL